jgi:predicted nucleotidyltransferase
VIASIKPGAADLRDIDYVLTNASRALHERVFAELAPEAVLDLDYVELGPRLLALDVARMTDPDEIARLIAIIDDLVLTPPDYAHLARACVAGSIARSIACMVAFRQGLVDGLHLSDELQDPSQT